MINIIVNGANGRMGKETVAAVEADPQLKLVGALVRGDHLGEQIRALKPDVVIDFTLPECVFENTKTIIESGVHPVIGASGLTHEQIQLFQKMCRDKKLGGIIAPNFSIGAVLMMKFSELAAAYLPDAEIIEYHHPAKKDAPSGTAKKTAQLIAQSRLKKPIIPQGPDRGFHENGITIHSVRLPGFLASQSVIFGGLEETLKIEHHSTHRKSFMPGVQLACKKVMKMDELVYGFENLF